MPARNMWRCPDCGDPEDLFDQLAGKGTISEVKERLGLHGKVTERESRFFAAGFEYGHQAGAASRDAAVAAAITAAFDEETASHIRGALLRAQMRDGAADV